MLVKINNLIWSPSENAVWKKTVNILSKISKETGLRLIHATFEKDPMRNGRVIHVWRGSIKKQDKHKK